MPSSLKPSTLGKALHANINTSAGRKKWLKHLDNLATLASDPLMKSLLLNPEISKDDLLKICTSTLDVTKDNQLVQFISIAIQYQCLQRISEVKQTFVKLCDQDSNTAKMQIVTANKVDKAQQEAIFTHLKTKFAVENIEAEFSIDKQIISGFIATWADKVYNTSMLGRLSMIQEHLIQK